MKKYAVSFIDSITQARRDDWQRLAATDNPFISYDYLSALETTGATGEGTAWKPHHALVHDQNGVLVAATPLYIKDDSWGEFVFDFAWAEAHHRNGIAYYPKLVTAVPYTPVAGPRLLVGKVDSGDAQSGDAQSGDAESRDAESGGNESGANRLAAINALLKAVEEKVESLDGSSWHMLFPNPESRALLESKSDYIVRKDCQFHWRNKDYTSFDHYLSHFRSSRRKKTRRERRKVAEAGIHVQLLHGSDMTQEQWEAFYELYASTFYARGRAPYFDLAFFTTIARSDLINIRVCFGLRDEQTIAASMFFETDTTLYGRYWGTREFVDGLHFELCYYQGIEYCIEKKLHTFDPGVQGEHKIARGFQASPSWSVHWLRFPPFADAIRNHVELESGHVKEYAEQVDQHLPFRKEDRNL
ncbi:MAG: GNAT family N-acetyltransferase [Gammaproteobacteria bacterium]